MTTALAPTPTTVTPPPRAMPVVAVTPTLYRFSVKQYQQMIEADVLNDDDKIELLEGYLVTKMSRNAPHDGTMEFITGHLFPLLPSGWRFRCQLAVECSDSQPEPDIALARGDTRTFFTRHPRADEIGLAIEVSDSSLERDRIDKARIYARAGIAEYWIVNLVDRQIEVHTLPIGETYTHVQNYVAGESLPLTLDGVVVATIPFTEVIP